MERYTILDEDAPSIPLIAGAYLRPAENGYAGLAAERLAKLEDLYEQLMAQQETLAKELETLRLAAKSSRIKTLSSCWTPMFSILLQVKNKRLGKNQVENTGLF